MSTVPEPRLLQFLTTTSKLLTVLYQLLPIVLVITFLIVAVVKSGRTLVLLEPFEFHATSGTGKYTGKGLANKLLDQINAMRERTQRLTRTVDYIPLLQLDRSEVDIQAGDVSAKSFVRYIRERFGPNVKHISGEAVLENGQFAITIRLPGKSGQTFEGKAQDLNIIMRQLAGYVLLAFEPYVLAVNQLAVDPTGSLDTIKHILTNDPLSDDAFAYDLWGRLLAAQGRYRAAHEKYANAVKLERNSAELYSNWGAVYYQEGNYQAAHEKYEFAKKLNPKLAAVHFNQALAFAAERKRDEEIAAYRKATVLDPLLRDAYFNWALTLRELNRRDEEIAMLEKTIEIDPRDAEAYVELGFALRAQQRYADAAKSLIEAIKLDPKSVRGHYYLGLVYEQLEQYPKAIEAFQQVIILDERGSFVPRVKTRLARLEKETPSISADSKNTIP